MALRAANNDGGTVETTYTITQRDIQRVHHNAAGISRWSMDFTPDYDPRDEPDITRLREAYSKKYRLVEPDYE